MGCCVIRTNVEVRAIEVRVYTVLGKLILMGVAWQSPANSAHRFFKVKVELP